MTLPNPATFAPDPPAPTPESAPRSVRLDLGLRVQALLRDRYGLSFGRMEPPPSSVLVAGGACRAWKYGGRSWAWWGYVGTCAITFAILAAGVTMRRLDAPDYLAATSFAWTAAAIAAVAWMMALQSRRRDRHVIAVAWDAGEQPLTPAERYAIVEGLRGRWPDARECWLLTLRTLGLPENDAGLHVIPLRESDLPRLSVGQGREVAAGPPD